MKQLIRVLFFVSDAAAWLLVCFGVLAILLYPVIGPIIQSMAHRPESHLSILLVVAAWMCMASGAYLTMRRHVFGLVLLSLPACFKVVEGEFADALVIQGLVAAIFGPPFALAFLDWRNSSRAAPPQVNSSS